MAEATPKLAACNKKLRTCTGWTIFFMVLLRISIGWHFFYEGAWKLMQDDWRATSYLVMSMGPMREVFRKMVPDVDGLEQLTPKGMQAHLDARCKQLIKHYDLEGDLAKQLLAFKDARRGKAEDDPKFIKQAAAASDALVNAVAADFQAVRKNPDVTSQPADLDANAVKAQIHIALGSLEGFRPTRIDGVTISPDVAEVVDKFMGDRGYAGKLSVLGVAFTKGQQSIRLGYVESMFADSDFATQVEDYTKLIAELSEYEHKLGTTGYNKERLLDQYGRKARAKAACIAKAEKPLRDMDVFLFGDMTPTPPKPGLLANAYMDAQAAGSPDVAKLHKQLSKGLPNYPSPTCWIDWSNMLALTAVGAGLMLGLFTRLSAFGGICLLMMYYWCMPSLPWLPEAGPMEGHYLIINKNIIEALALAMIATSRIGRWGGLDGILFRGSRLEKISKAAQG